MHGGHRAFAFSHFLVCLAIACPAFAADAPAVEKTPVIFDTDFGGDADDGLTLAWLLASPEIDLRGVTISTSDTEPRARMICRLLDAAARKDVPVAKGAEPQPKREVTFLRQYYYHPAALSGRMGKPIATPAAEFLFEKLKAEPGKITIVCVGPLTNIARLLKDHPEAVKMIKRVVVSTKCSFPDADALEAVLKSEVPLFVAEAELIQTFPLVAKERAALSQVSNLLSMQLIAFDQMEPRRGERGGHWWVATLAASKEGKEMKMKPTASGFEKSEQGRAVTYLEMNPSDKDDPIVPPNAIEQLAARLAKFAPKVTNKPPGNRTELIERRGLPARVHAMEDYDTDIEKRWFMTGNVFPDIEPNRAGRYAYGVLTQNFDDLQGDHAVMYNSVIFNPVPGPPMGKNTRLSFRYYLKGTDTLHIQLYTLSNGYHRYLSVAGLKQGSWQEGTVDMTKMRRVDGTGGPLAENERIDDIQFYCDPNAELRIDDIVLYDEAPAGESVPFPKRFLFTGIFDTGKQGAEWPGTFEIALHEKPREWKYAKSVAREGKEEEWIRVHLRGERTIGMKLKVRFDYRLGDADKLQVRLVNSKNKVEVALDVDSPKRDEWTTTTLDFTDRPISAGANSILKAEDTIDEVWFVVPKGAKLGVDNLLIWEP